MLNGEPIPETPLLQTKKYPNKNMGFKMHDSDPPREYTILANGRKSGDTPANNNEWIDHLEQWLEGSSGERDYLNPVQTIYCRCPSEPRSNETKGKQLPRRPFQTAWY